MSSFSVQPWVFRSGTTATAAAATPSPSPPPCHLCPTPTRGWRLRSACFPNSRRRCRRAWDAFPGRRCSTPRSSFRRWVRRPPPPFFRRLAACRRQTWGACPCLLTWRGIPPWLCWAGKLDARVSLFSVSSGVLNPEQCCGSGINTPDPNVSIGTRIKKIRDPGSAVRIKEFKYF